MDPNSNFKRKTNRIRDFSYTGQNAYFLTICTYNKTHYFYSKELIDNVLAVLNNEIKRTDFILYAYCFMPDHLHLLLVGEETSNLFNCIKLFKQRTGYSFKQNSGNYLWQKSYYDHVLRDFESIDNFTLYIFDNPVKGQLTDDFRKYPYLGSAIMTLEEAYQLYADVDKTDIRTLLETRNR